MQYKLIDGEPTSGIAQMSEDGTIATVPNCPGNRDWQAYQAWVADGNTPLPANADWA